jgi:hypothetical protein
MPSTSERVTLPGVLRGQGQEARCTVEADKVSLPGGSDVNYTNYRINPGSVSKRLPDGNYTLTVIGVLHDVRHNNGLWTSASHMG